MEKLRSLILFCFNSYAVLNRSESESESRRQRGIKRVSSGIGGRNAAVIHPRQEGKKKTIKQKWNSDGLKTIEKQ